VITILFLLFIVLTLMTYLLCVLSDRIKEIERSIDSFIARNDAKSTEKTISAYDLSKVPGISRSREKAARAASEREGGKG
jgi:hypothetical protein